jgi:replicative DNA helicase
MSQARSQHSSSPGGAAGQVRVLGGTRVPPHDLEAETSVLGSLLLEPGAIERVQDLVGVEDFYPENHRQVFQAALALLRQGEPIDSVTVAGELEKMGVLDRIGGRSQLALLQESVPTAANVEHYARRVYYLAVRRRILEQADQLYAAAHDPGVELKDLDDRVAALPELTGRAAPWGQPLPLVDSRSLPEFPVEMLPDWCAAYADALAEATQTPADLPGLLVLAGLAACAGGRVRVEVRPGWVEPLNLYVLVALPPGERKTAVFDAVTTPLSEFEEERARTLSPVIAEAAVRRRTLEKAAETAQAEAARAKTEAAREAAIQRATELAGQAQAVAVPAPYRLLADDSTPEALTSLLAEQGGRIAVLSDEGGVFGQMAGRYSPTGRVSNLDVYLKGHAGSRLRVDRKGRPPEYVPRPALTIGVAVQPEVLRGMAQVPEFRGLGILARFVYSLPTSRMGSRRPDADPVPPDLSDEYAASLRTLARSLDAVGAGGGLIRFAPDSVRLLNGWAAALEPRLGEDGDLRHMADWAGKLAGAVARMAALIHLGRNVRAAWGSEVPPAAVEAALGVGEYAIAHAQAVFAVMGADPQVELARRVLRWMRDRGLSEFTRRDAFDQLRSNNLAKVTDLDPPLALLVAHDYVAPVPSVRSSGGGRPSQKFRVNPRVRDPQELGRPTS